jgi:hypothetical protein
LQLPYNIYEENSGLALKLAWRTVGYNENNMWGPPVWLDAEKIEELGFDIHAFLSSDDTITDYRQPLPREVFIVLEKDGEPYREAVRRAEAKFKKEKKAFELNPDDKDLRYAYERAEKRLKRERLSETRLFAIDAGLDFNELRDMYGDQNRFIVTKGLIRAQFDQCDKKVSGRISDLSVENIHVPLKQRQVFDSILAQTKDAEDDIVPPRYEVELAFGKRLEPWIVSVKKIK